MKQFRIGSGAVLGAIALLGVAGCGLYGGGGGGGTKVEVTGNIAGVVPTDTGRDIVVFVYRVKDVPEDCTQPVLPDDKTQNESVTVPDGDTAFDVKNSKAGRLVIVFLLDNPGKDADGKIDPGDPVAVLNDPDCVLDDVPDKYVIQASDVRVNFSLDGAIGFPEPGRAEAALIKESPRP